MAIIVEYIKFTPYYFTPETTNYLLATKDERIQVAIKFKAVWEIVADDENQMHFVNPDAISIKDLDDEFVQDIWERNEFRVGDTALIQGTASNNVSTAEILRFEDNGATAIFSGAAFVNETSTTGTISGTTELKGTTLRFNFIENDAAETYSSLIDGNENRWSIDDNSGGGFLPMEHQGKFKSNKIGNISSAKFGANEFLVVQQINLVPFVLSGQLTDLQNGESPDYFKDFNCLKYIYEITLHKSILDPNYVQVSNEAFLIANTGDFDERFNGGDPEYNLISTTFKNLADDVIAQPDFTLINKVEIIINSAEGKFSDTNTKFTLQHAYIPTDSSEHTDTDTDVETNFMFDQAVQTLGGVAVNGGGFGTQKQVFTDIEGEFIDINTMKVTALIDLSTDYKTRFASNDGNFYIGLTTQDHLLETELSDKVPINCVVSQYIIDNSNPDVGTISSEFFQHHSVDLDTYPKSDVGTFVEDWQIAKSIFSIDTANGATVKGVEFRVYAENVTYGEFDLQLSSFSTESAPVVSGIQIIDVSETIGYKMAAGNVFNELVIKRRDDLDSGDDKFYEVDFPFKIRWEDFIALPEASEQFFNTNELENGLNNDWAHYYNAAGWTLKFEATAIITETFFDNRITAINTVTAETYGAATDWEHDILSFDTATNTDITGSFLTDDLTTIKARFKKIAGTPPALSETAGWIGVAPNEAGGDKVIREMSSVHVQESDSPWISIEGTKLCKKEEDPFDIHDKRKVRIKEFLVFKELDDERDNYIIKNFERTKEQTLEALEFIQKIIKNYPDMNSERIKGYLTRQRFFMKLFLKEVNREFSE